eukprot:9017152-Prorocentrum_lima.AAC.1
MSREMRGVCDAAHSPHPQHTCTTPHHPPHHITHPLQNAVHCRTQAPLRNMGIDCFPCLRC